MIMTEEIMRETLFPKDAFGKLCAITLLDLHEGYAKVQMPLDDLHKNAANVAHGGAIYTLADIAFGMACNLGKTHVMLNISANINYMKMGKSGPFIAEATKLNGSKKIETYQVHIFDGEGTLIAAALFVGCRTPIVYEV